MASTWSPASSVVEPTAISAFPERMTEMSRAPSGSDSRSTFFPAEGESFEIWTSTISRFSLRSSSRWTSWCSGTSCSMSAMMFEVAQIVGEMPSRSKCAWLRGSFTRAITFGAPYFSFASWQMTRLSSSSPVTASTRSGGRLIPARSRMKSSVASPRWTMCSNSSSSEAKRSARCSISVTSCPDRSRILARFAPTLPPPQTRMYTLRLHLRGFAGADGFDQCVDRRRGRADRVQAALLVERGARGIEHAHDDAWVREALLRDLADHEVRVVAVGGHDDGLGVIDAGRAQDVDVHAVPEHEPAGPALAEPRERFLLLVDGGDVPTLVEELPRDVRAHPAAADDYCLHAFSVAPGARAGSSASSSSSAPCGNATTSTSHGAFFRT